MMKREAVLNVSTCHGAALGRTESRKLPEKSTNCGPAVEQNAHEWDVSLA